LANIFRLVLPRLFLGLLAVLPMPAADQPPGVISAEGPAESKDPAPLPDEPDESWMPASEAADNAITQFDAVKDQFTKVADLVYWETRRAFAERASTPGKKRAAYQLIEGEQYLVPKAMASLPAMVYPRSPDGAFLVKQALTARLAQPYDGMPPPREEMRWGAILWMDILPPQEQVDFLMLGFEALALSVDQASDEEWRRRGAEASPEAFSAFKDASLETAMRTTFADRPDCGEVFHHAATGMTQALSRLPWDKRGPWRQAYWEQMKARAKVWVGFRTKLALERELRLLEAQTAKNLADHAELTKELEALTLKKARREAKAKREMEQAARNALEQKALREAESAPPSKAEQERRDELRRVELAQAEELRKLAQEVKKHNEKAGVRPDPEGKEEKVEKKQGPRVRWHPEARVEFTDAVNEKTRKRIDDFVNNTLRLKGAELGMPQAQPITGGEGIWELRPLGRWTGAWRPLYALVKEEFVILAFAPEFMNNRDGFRRALADAQKRRTRLLAAK
jgi:hypothetical protein